MVAFCRLGCGVGRPNVCSRINRAGIEALGDSSGDGTRDGETKRERGREESKRKEMEGKCKSVEKRVKKRENKGWKYIYMYIYRVSKSFSLKWRIFEIEWILERFLLDFV